MPVFVLGGGAGVCKARTVVRRLGTAKMLRYHSVVRGLGAAKKSRYHVGKVSTYLGMRLACNARAPQVFSHPRTERTVRRMPCRSSASSLFPWTSCPRGDTQGSYCWKPPRLMSRQCFQSRHHANHRSLRRFVTLGTARDTQAPPSPRGSSLTGSSLTGS